MNTEGENESREEDEKRRGQMNRFYKAVARYKKKHGEAPSSELLEEMREKSKTPQPVGQPKVFTPEEAVKRLRQRDRFYKAVASYKKKHGVDPIPELLEEMREKSKTPQKKGRRSLLNPEEAQKRQDQKDRFYGMVSRYKKKHGEAPSSELLEEMREKSKTPQKKGHRSLLTPEEVKSPNPQKDQKNRLRCAVALYKKKHGEAPSSDILEEMKEKSKVAYHLGLFNIVKPEEAQKQRDQKFNFSKLI